MSKRLGQHFLKNKKKIRKIVDALELQNGDTVVEIGPGKGALTKEILKNKIKYIGIEKDEELIDELLSSKFVREKDNIEIIEGDILKILPGLTTYKLTTLKLVGNIPYYITGQLLRILGEIEKKPKFIVLTIQKEVAERLVVKPPNMNILGASVQVWGDVKIIEQIPKEDFKPVPKIDSAVIKIVPRGNKIPEGYYQLVKILFRHPRKTILNNLSIGLEKEVVSKKIKDMGFDPKIRPQNLSVENIKKLAGVLLDKNNQSVH
jgi:16S rRNA (adenine1518-N6/adenine1519-N6)-dimethyltransferase